MTVVDVNTGKFTGQGGNLEETVTRNNLEAAEEIVRQLRLRDVGGIVVIDFIDMVLESNRELVLRRLLECLARDRTKHQVAEVTSLGLVQMTRKRVGAGLLEAFSTPCECCNGRGVILTYDADTDGQASHHTHGRGGAGQSGGGNGGRVPAPAAMVSPASVAARARPAEIAPAATTAPDATVQADAGTFPAEAGVPDAAAVNGRDPDPQAGSVQADSAQANGEVPEAQREPARSGSGRRRRRKPSGLAAPLPADPAAAASPPDPVQADPVQADPVQADPVQADPVQADSTGRPGRPGTGRPGTGRPSTGRRWRRLNRAIPDRGRQIPNGPGSCSR